jgi:Yip1 domain
MDGRAETLGAAAASEREWWLRVPLVLLSPRHVFAALRDDSDAAAHARQEPVLAIAVLAGIGGVLSSNVTGRLFDDPEFDALLVAVWAFVAGGLYGAIGLFGLGVLLHLGATLAGSLGSYRRARHVLAFVAVPFVFALPLWVVRLSVYGEDALRRGGADSGTGNGVFEAIEVGLLAWVLALVVLGVRVVHGWTWARSLAASGFLLGLAGLALLDAYGVF